MTEPIREAPGQTLVDVGGIDDFPLGIATIVEIRGRKVGVLRMASDEIYAVLNVCPHRGAPVCEGRIGGTLVPAPPGQLKYGLPRRVIACPWHGWEFDVATGNALFRVSEARVVRFPVRVTDADRVLVGTTPIALGSE